MSPQGPRFSVDFGSVFDSRNSEQCRAMDNSVEDFYALLY